MLDELIVNLTTIGKLSPGDKIAVEKGKIFISSSRYQRPLARWFNNQNRYNSIDFLKNTIDFALQYSYSKMDLIKTLKLNTDKPSSDEILIKSNDELKIIINTFQNILRGLEELKGTYKDDRSVLSSLDVIINKIQKIYEEYTSLCL
tara:strand:- start:1065 stop:1505 length:441 start_codon:yes stop_codon:yes gene_type:complete